MPTPALKRTPRLLLRRYLQVGDPALALPSVAVRVGRGRRLGRPLEFVGGNAAGVPVGPKDAVGLDVHVHRIYSNAGVALEGLLVAPVGHAGVQAADLVIVGDVENLPTAVNAWVEKTIGHKDVFFFLNQP